MMMGRLRRSVPMATPRQTRRLGSLQWLGQDERLTNGFLEPGEVAVIGIRVNSSEALDRARELANMAVPRRQFAQPTRT